MWEEDQPHWFSKVQIKETTFFCLFVLFCNQAKILKIDNTVLAIVQEDRLSSMVGRN